MDNYKSLDTRLKNAIKAYLEGRRCLPIILEVTPNTNTIIESFRLDPKEIIYIHLLPDGWSDMSVEIKKLYATRVRNRVHYARSRKSVGEYKARGEKKEIPPSEEDLLMKKILSGKWTTNEA